jgi:AraC-like DNA-binding protein
MRLVKACINPEGDGTVICTNSVGLLLSDRFTRVLTADLLKASPVIEGIQGAFVANEKRLGRDCPGPVHVRAAACGKVGVSTFRFGRPVDIIPQGLTDAILVTTAIKGKAGMSTNGNSCSIAFGSSFISHEEDCPRFLYDTDTEVLKLRFNRRHVEEFAMKMYGHGFKGPLHFHTEMSLPHAAQRWVTLLSFLVSSLNGTGTLQPSSREMASLEEMLMLTLLNIQPHSYQPASGCQARNISTRQFRSAVDYINDHLACEITLADIAEATGCSIRSLARAFNRAGDTTPMQYVCKLRLQKIRTELLSIASREQTIAGIAYRWGYGHLGEFNRKYREAFGETPSETRQKSHWLY